MGPFGTAWWPGGLINANPMGGLHVVIDASTYRQVYTFLGKGILQGKKLLNDNSNYDYNGNMIKRIA